MADEDQEEIPDRDGDDDEKALEAATGKVSINGVH